VIRREQGMTHLSRVRRLHEAGVSIWLLSYAGIASKEQSHDD
jgi:hypothetical protein